MAEPRFQVKAVGEVQAAGPVVWPGIYLVEVVGWQKEPPQVGQILQPVPSVAEPEGK